MGRFGGEEFKKVDYQNVPQIPNPLLPRNTLGKSSELFRNSNLFSKKRN